MTINHGIEVRYSFHYTKRYVSSFSTLKYIWSGASFHTILLRLPLTLHPLLDSKHIPLSTRPQVIPASLLTSPPSRRFGASSLHQRDPRNALFENYNGGASQPRTGTSSPNRPATYGGGYGYSGAGNGSANLGPFTEAQLGYRPATPNSRYVHSFEDG
jgi:hypothetical protein